MTEDVLCVAQGCIYLQARLLPVSTKGSFGYKLFDLPDPLAVGSDYVDSKYLPHPWQAGKLFAKMV